MSLHVDERLEMRCFGSMLPANSTLTIVLEVSFGTNTLQIFITAPALPHILTSLVYI
jgi:hypothetical protein